MRRINYKSDIPPLLLSLKVDEKQITVPDCDFIVRFYIEGYEGRHYDCSHIGGVWSNCEPSEDGTKLVCYINNQRLGIGELCAEFHYISPDRRYSDGSQKSVVIIDSTELGVELVEDNGDAVTEAAIDVTLPFIYRTAYEIAREHGYTGTAEDFYSALASVVAIADAEKKRVTAEITRNANEQERIENEENRLNAESERVNAEAQRVRNEAIRCDAESDRVEQEEDRKAKFVEITGFIATVRANEGNRESNELERQTNEDTRITEEAKRVEAEKKRAAEFEQQKLDLTGKIDRSGDEMGGDLIFTDNAGVSFGTSDGGEHSMFNDTDDVAKFTADNGDTFEFKQNETPNKNSSAVVVSANLYNALDMTLDSMGSALDGDAAYRAEAGDKIFNPDTCKIQRYNSTIGGFEDLCDPIDGKLYANKMTDYIYRWNTKAKKMVFVGGVKAYTKDEADSRFAKLDDATQIVKAKDLEANNSVTAKSMWIGDEGLLLGGDGNGHLTVEQDEVITDVTLNVKLATKADDVAYGVEWYNGQPTGEMQETTVKDATKNTTVTTLMLAQSYNVLEQEVDKKVSKTDIVQNPGQSTTSVMSQKAVSDNLSEVCGKVEEIGEVIDKIVLVSPNLFDVSFVGRAFISVSGSNAGKVYLNNNDNYASTPDAISVKQSTLYSFFCNNPFAYDIGATVVFYGLSGVYISNATYGFNTGSHTLFQFTTPNECAFVRLMLRATGKGNELALITQWQLNEGEKKEYQEPGPSINIEGNSVSIFNNAEQQEMSPCLTNNVVKPYIDNVDYTSIDYTSSEIKQYENVIGFYDFDKPFGILIKWTPVENVILQTVLLSTVSTQVVNADALRFDVPVGESKLCIKNLLPNKKYYYKVMVVTDTGEEKQVKLSQFTTTKDMLRMLDIDGVRNVRDIGGWKTDDNKHLKYGLLVRGGELIDTASGYNISDKGRYDLLKVVGVRCDLDLRGGNRDSSELGNSVIYSNVEFQAYKNALTNGATATVSAFQFITEQLGHNRTIYFHCQGGQDRTGTLALLIEGLCGVSESDLSKDYELTEFAHPALGSGTPSATRTRSQFVELIEYINTFNGDTMKDKIYNALVSIGVSSESLNSIQQLMIEI